MWWEKHICVWFVLIYFVSVVCKLGTLFLGNLFLLWIVMEIREQELLGNSLKIYCSCGYLVFSWYLSYKVCFGVFVDSTVTIFKLFLAVYFPF